MNMCNLYNTKICMHLSPFDLQIIDFSNAYIKSTVDSMQNIYMRCPDIFEKMQAMKPGFIRMPGGNYLEGTGPHTRWDWRASIGPKEARRGHYNSAWGYWVTDG